MEDLRELIDIINPKKVEALRRSTGAVVLKDKQAKQLYDLIAGRKVRTEEEAVQMMFGASKSAARRFRRVKRVLREHLLRLLLMVDLTQAHHHQRQKAYFECYRNWGALKLLSGKSAHQSVLELSKPTLKIAQKYEFTDVALDVVRHLRLYYGSLEGNLRKFEQYGRMARELEEVVYFENLSEELYTYLVIRFVNDKSTKMDVHKQAKQYYLQLETAMSKYKTYRLHFCGRLIEALVHTSINDYRSTLEVCDRAIRFFEAKKYIATIPLQVFLYQEMVCFVQLRDFENGEAAARRGLKLLDVGSFNWFKYQELLLTLSLHARRYQKAYEIFRLTVGHRRFQSLPAGIRQTWKILEAYLYYLIDSGKIEPLKDDKVFNRFRMARFVNEVPIFSKDKRGMNIPILILQILYLLLHRRFGETIDRMEAIERYTSRYLKVNEHFRSSCFIKMLLQAPNAEFHPAAVQRHAEKFRKMLDKMPLDFAGQSHDIEIIPYEDIWEMVLESLERQDILSDGLSD
jgi:hypothetical protein